eukprot:13242843-Alexandrium_andersonii.AAC.1
MAAQSKAKACVRILPSARKCMGARAQGSTGTPRLHSTASPMSDGAACPIPNVHNGSRQLKPSGTCCGQL